MSAYESNKFLRLTQGAYLSVFDIASPINVEGVWDQLFSRAQKAAGARPGLTIQWINTMLGEYARSKNILSWTFTFDGVYQIIVSQNCDDKLTERCEPLAFVPSESPLAYLNCPTGRIAVESLSHLGRADLTPVIIIEPGIYHVSLFVDFDQLNKHQLLEKVSEYPREEGPDWMLNFQREA